MPCNLQHLLTSTPCRSPGSTLQEFDSPSSIPLDENSQEVLSLLARSASEPQGPALLPQRSRFAPAGPLLGSEPQGPGGSGASRLARGPSFVGRQPSVLRLHSGGLAGVGSKSFVFGRDDSNSAAPAADKVGLLRLLLGSSLCCHCRWGGRAG